MEKINRCLKLCFLIYNAVIVSIGLGMTVILIIIAIVTQLPVGVSVLLWIYVISVLAISILGLRAGRKEKGLLLKIFAGVIMAALVANLVLGFIVVARQAQVYGPKSQLWDSWMQEELIWRQEYEKCCGILGASDWGSQIPESCDCSYNYYYDYGSDCIDAPVGSYGPRRVYREGCGFHSAHARMFEAAMGVCFGTAAIFLLDFIMALVMIKQVKHADVTAPVLDESAEPLPSSSGTCPGVSVVHI
ncbi:23 kDa integral membrane protein-like [Synchiropus splendidus]|uniref:23 kDa integral membrane protein-like n=1 Tax=Synchiropus splendidus TaxID=270530 RepID=UPI00237EC235|nr:23 kDa integral membrane protein-like [Synchiropus splendidus]XP_053720035.1 23 kDa integral membrane protein-like [Synchiropus splendidus]